MVCSTKCLTKISPEVSGNPAIKISGSPTPPIDLLKASISNVDWLLRVFSKTLSIVSPSTM